MIHEEICTYEVCKLAKEKGFPQHPNENNHCDMYCWDGLRNIHPLNNWVVWCMEEYNHENLYAAPTQNLLHWWLRKEKGFIVCVVLDTRLLVEECKVRYGWVISNKNAFKCGEYDTKQIITDKRFDVYEEALEDALKYTLENLV